LLAAALVVGPTRTDADLAMPDFNAVFAAGCALVLPLVRASSAAALALSFSSGEVEIETSSSSCSPILFSMAAVRASPSIVIALCFCGSSAVGDNTTLLATPDIEPGGSNKLLRLFASLFGCCELDVGIGRREGDSSMLICVYACDNRLQSHCSKLAIITEVWIYTGTNLGGYSCY
jgi:hypothetical protein